MAKKRTIKKVVTNAEGLPSGAKSGSALIREQLTKGVTKPSEIRAAIKAEYGIEVSQALVGGVKNGMKKKAGGKSKISKRFRTAQAAPASGVSVGNSVPLDMVEAAIVLAEKYGASKAREIIKVLWHEVGGS